MREGLPANTTRPGSGFTLIEVVVALILLGILAAVAITRFTALNASALGEAEVFKACLRYAQQRAMGDISTWGITIDSDSQYSLFTNNPDLKASPVLPGVGGNSRTLPAGTTVAASNSTITFDYRGQVVTGAGPGAAAGTEYLKNGTYPALVGEDVTVTFAGESAVNVVVHRHTGFAANE